MAQINPINQVKAFAEILGELPSEEQCQNVVSFIVDEVPRCQWQYCREICMYTGDVYTLMGERMGEWGL